MQDHVVTLDGVAKTYGAGDLAVHALHPTGLAVDAGEFVVLLGPSGSGKTTFLDLVGGIERPTAGHLLVDGRDLAALGGEELTRYRREDVGFVFQFFNLVPTLTALENVELMAELVGRGGREPRRRWRRSASATASTTSRARCPAASSSASRSLARSSSEPRLLLCDEPTGSLDLDTGRQVLDAAPGAAGEGRGP